jgi:hypothetical protein
MTHQVQFETIKPTPTPFAARRSSGKYFVSMNPTVMADPKGQAVDEWNAGRLALTGLQISPERKQCHRNQFDKASVAGKSGKVSAPLPPPVIQIKGLKGAVRRDRKEDQDRHHLAQGQAWRALLL